MMGWYGGGAGWVMMLTSSVLGIALIAVVVWALLRVTSPGSGVSGPVRETPREILDRRLASGEIDVESYRTAVRELTGGQQPEHRNG
jgi:putative membrane protein